MRTFHSRVFIEETIRGKKIIIKHKIDPPIHQYTAEEAFDIWSTGEIKTYLHKIKQGSKEEDEDNYHDGIPGPDSFLEHYWDPDGGPDDGLFLHSSAYTLAQYWWDNKVIPNYPGNESTAYYYLGRIVHLLTDMTVPAHVHNDPHCGNEWEDSVWSWLGFPIVGDDNYEDYMSEDSDDYDNHYNYEQWSNTSHHNWAILEGITCRYDYSNLYDLFKGTAEYTDQFESDGKPGEDPNHPDNWGDVSYTECRVHGNYLMPHAIKAVAGLYQLFWGKTHPPTVSISSPANNSTVSGIATVTGFATDAVGVKKVNYYLDNSTIVAWSVNVSPFGLLPSWSWDSTTTSNGLHTITAIAYNTVGNKSLPSTITVTVNNPTGNNSPNPPTSLTQYKSNGSTGLGFGGTTDERNVMLKGNVTDPDGNAVSLEVEVKPVGVAFSNSPSPNCSCDGPVASGGTAAATCSGLANGQYRWQARAKDSFGAMSSWRSAGGGNAESTADFIVSAGSAPVNDPPRVTIILPNGGETLIAGSSYEIKWIATDDQGIRLVTLYYSEDGGNSWTGIPGAAFLDNPGSYQWTVPNISSTTVKVKAIALDRELASVDFSNGNFSVIESCNTPSTPNLFDPGLWSETGNYTIVWQDISSATGYLLQESTSSSFSNVTEYSIPTPSKYISGKANGIYYYRVKTVNDCGYSAAWSNTVDMEVRVNAPPNMPGNPSPYDGKSNVGRQQPTLSWSGGDPDGPVEYAVFFGTDPNPGGYAGYAEVNGTSYQIPSTLQAGIKYYWGVKARDDKGLETQSPIWSFTTASSPSPPSLTSFNINNGASTTTSQTVTLNNSATNNPTHYMASENSNFSGASWQTYSTSPSFTLSSGYGTKAVYLKVKNAGGESNTRNDSIEYAPNAPSLTSFNINNGASTTTSQTVTLNNSATNNPTHYMASENSNFSGASWQTYSTSPSFTLSSGYGTKTVYLKVKNTGGESNTRNDSIGYNTPPTANAGSDASICPGTCTTLNGVATGGTPPYTYSWSPTTDLSNPNIANPVACPITTTTYTLTVTDYNSYSDNDQVTVTVNPNPTANAGSDVNICAGSCTTLSGSASGDTGPYTYSWSPATGLDNPNIASPTACPTTTTTYTLTVEDSNGCIDQDQVVVTVNPNPTANGGSNKSICSGSSTSIGGSPTGTGGTSPYTYSWSPSTGLSSSTAANPTASPTATTTYTVTVTDANTCQATDQVTVTVNENPTADAGSDASICPGGSVQIGGSPTASDGTSPYTYSWSPATGLNSTTTANPNALPTSTTTYTVTVTDANGCQNTDQVTVTVNPKPTADAGSDVSICAGTCTTLNGSASGGSSPYTYSWTPTTGLSNSNIANPEACPQRTTTYTLTVTDANGCQNTDQVTVTVNPNPTADAGPDASICSGSSTSIGGSPTASGGTYPYTYFWSPSTGLSSTTTANPNASPTSTTTYTLTVTDANGCQNTDQVTVTVNENPTTDAGSDKSICSGSSTSIGGSPTGTGGASPYSYSWSPATGLSSTTTANPTASPTSTTTYTVTVTDSKGCQDSDQVTVTVNPKPTANAGSDVSVCAGSCTTLNGSASGGAGGYTYLWTPASAFSNPNIANPEACPQTTTTYTLTVTDANGCQNTDQVTVTVNPNPTADAGPDASICSGGSVQIGGSPTASGGSSPYTYSWSPTTGLSSSTVANPNASPTTTTTYTVTVTDANGCQATDQVTVTVNPNPTANAGSDVSICAGSSTSIGGSPTASGGTSPYTYSWSPSTGLSSTTTANPIASPISTTTYTLTVTDANGCQNTDQVTVTVNENPTANAGSDVSICAGSSVQIGGSPTASGGTSPYTYSWSPSTGLSSSIVANPNASPTSTTTYTVTVTDANGCQATDQVTVTVNPNPTADAGSDEQICSGSSVQIGGSPTASGGTSPYTYSWSPSTGLSSSTAANPNASPTTTTTYTVTVTDDNGCQATDQVTVTVNENPTADAGSDASICSGGSVQIGGSPTGTGGTSLPTPIPGLHLLVLVVPPQPIPMPHQRQPLLTP